MKRIIFPLTLVMLTSCASSVDIRPESNIAGEDMIINIEALESYSTKYVLAKANKAFAQSSSGSWAWTLEKTSVEHAMSTALIICEDNNRKHQAKYPCKVINVNDEWLNQ